MPVDLRQISFYPAQRQYIANDSQPSLELVQSGSGDYIVCRATGGGTPVFQVTNAGVISGAAGIFEASLIRSIAGQDMTINANGASNSVFFQINGQNKLTISPTAGISISQNVNATTPAITLQNSFDSASNLVAVFAGADRGTAVDDDNAYISYQLEDSSGTQAEAARMRWELNDVTSTTKDGRVVFSVMVNNTLTDVLDIQSTASSDVTSTFSGNTVFNDNVSLLLGTGGNEGDFSSDGTDVKLLLKGGADFVIGRTGLPSPDNLLHLWEATAGSVSAVADSLLILENNDNAYISVLAPTVGGIIFGDAADNDVGKITYTHSSNTLNTTIAGISQLNHTNGTFAFAKATTINTSSGTLTLGAWSAGGAIDFANHNMTRVDINSGNIADVTFNGTTTATADMTFNDNVQATFGTGGDADIGYNGTDLVINTRVVGTGDIVTHSQLTWGTGVAVTAADYSIGRDADGTNQMHLNVPSGAGWEYSINDVAKLTYATGAFQFKEATTVSTSAGALTLNGAAGIVINESGADADFRIESNSNANALVLDANTFGGVGSLALGNAVVNTAYIRIAPPALTSTADTSFSAVRIAPIGVTVPSGTSPIVASLHVREPVITATGTATTAATVYIENAPTEGGANHALMVAAGSTSLAGSLTVTGGGSLTGTWSDLGTVTTVDINGGTIDGVSIGASTAATSIVVDQLTLNDGTISTTASNNPIIITPHGIGDVNLSADTVRVGDQNANATITTFGTGDLILNTNAGTNSGSITIADGVDGDITVATNGTGAISFSDKNITNVGNIALDSLTADGSTITITGNTTFADGAYNFNVASHDGSNGLQLGGTLVTASAAELNIIDGGTSATSTTLADADRVVVNDAGTMKQVALTDFETYMETSLDTLGNVTTVGALNAGSITSGFGNIDTGSSNITTTGTISAGNLTVTGTTTTVNSTIVTVDDPIFQVGGDTAPGSDDDKDRGIAFRWHNGSSAKNGFFGYDDSSGKFTFIPDASFSGEVVSGTAGTIVATTFEGTATTATLANTATALATARNIGGVSFDGTAAITPTQIAAAANATNENQFIAFLDDSNTSAQQVLYDAGLLYNPSTNNLTTTTFTGSLAGTATEATNVTATANNTTNETVYVTFVDGQTGTQGIETDSGLTYNPSTGILTASGGFSGVVTGTAETATALANARTIGMTGDVVWTSPSFDGSANVTAAATIQTNAVQAAMVHEDVISGRTELTSGNVATGADFLLLWDATDSAYKKVKPDNLGVSGLASGSANEIQYNNSNSFAGATNVEIKNNSLALKEQSAPTNVSGYGMLYTTSTNELFFKDDGGNATQITNAGALAGGGAFKGTKLYLTNGTTSVANNSAATMTAWTESFDVGGMHNASSNTDRITFGQTGYWTISIQQEWAADSSGYREMRVTHTDTSNSNATNVILRDRAIPSLQDTTVSGSSTVFYVDDVADYLTVQLYQNSGAALNAVGNNDDSTVVTVTRLDMATQGSGTASGSAGHVQFSDGSGGFSHDNNAIFWDATNNRLGVNTSSPSYSIDLTASGTIRAQTYTGTIGTATQNSITTMTGLVSTGALASGSIASGFGTISTGNGITTTAALTGGSLVVDNFTLNGTELDLSAGDFTVDVAGDITLNADGGDINFMDDSASLGTISSTGYSGNSATATTATNITAANNTTNADQFVAFLDNSSTSAQQVLYNTGITFNPSINALTTTTGVFGTLTVAAGSITDSSGTISFGNENITTTGTATVGNLTVNGTTTTVNSTTVTVDDPIFTLGGDTAPGSDDNKDRGIEFRYHDGSSARVGFFGYDDSAGVFTGFTAATNSSEVFSGTAMNATFGTITGSSLVGTLATAAQGSITSVGTLTGLGLVQDANITFASGMTINDDSSNNAAYINLASGDALYLQDGGTTNMSIAASGAITMQAGDLTLGTGADSDNGIKFNGHGASYYIGFNQNDDYMYLGKGTTIGSLPGIVVGNQANIGIGVIPSTQINIRNVQNNPVITDNNARYGQVNNLFWHKTSAAYTSAAYAGYFVANVDTTNTQNWTNAVGLRGVYAKANVTAQAGGSAAAITGMAGVYIASNTIDTSGSTDATVTNNYGLYVENQTAGTNDYGVYIAGGATYGLWVDSGVSRFDGNLLVNGSVFFGSAGSNYDVKFYGDTSGRDMVWDAGNDSLEFEDNAKAVFGASQDFKIYHDGSTNIIDGGGTADIKIQDSNHTSAIFDTSAEVQLYYDNAKTFETQGSGAIVQGPTNAILDIKKADAGTGNLRFLNGSTEEFRIWLDNAEARLGFSTDGGSTNAMMIQESNGHVGIGIATNVPDQKLTVGGHILLTSATDADSANKYSIIAEEHYDTDDEEWVMMSGWSQAASHTLALGGFDNAFNAATEIKFYTAADVTTRTGTEHMKIDSTGNVFVTDGTLYVDSGTTNTTAKFESSDAEAVFHILDSNSSATYPPGFEVNGNVLSLRGGTSASWAAGLTINHNGIPAVGGASPDSNAMFSVYATKAGHYNGAVQLQPTLSGNSNSGTGNALLTTVTGETSDSSHHFGTRMRYTKNTATGTQAGARTLYIESPVVNAGTLTNAYGLWIDAGTAATNNYAAYLNGKVDIINNTSGVWMNIGPQTIDNTTREGGIQLNISGGTSDRSWGIWGDANNPRALRFEYLGARGTAFGSGTSGITVDYTGNVGIGSHATTPAVALEIDQGANTDSVVRILHNDSYYLELDPNLIKMHRASGSSADLTIETSSAGTPASGAGNIILDSLYDVVIDSDNYGMLRGKDSGVEKWNIYNDSSGNITFKNVTQDRGIGFRVNDGGSNVDALYIYGSTSDVSLVNTKMLRWGGESGTTRIYGDSSADLMTFVTNGNEALRIASSGQVGIAGANYGTDGQVLTSKGNSASPEWADASGGGVGQAIAMAIVFGG